MRAFSSLVLLLAFAAPLTASAKGGVEVWQAESHTAMGITGTIRLSPTAFVSAGKTLPLRVAADVPSYKTDTVAYPARILEVRRPADPILLNGNRLCGGPGKVQWLVVYRLSKTELGMSVFSEGPRPTSDASPNLCGTYTYSR